MFRNALLILLLLLGLAGAALAGGERYGLEVKGLACPFCSYGIEKKLNGLEGVEAVEVDIGKGRVVVTATDRATLSEEQFRRAVKDAGFTLEGFEKLNTEGANRD